MTRAWITGLSACLLAACTLSQFGVRPPGFPTHAASYDATARELLITQPLQAEPGKTSQLAIERLGQPLRQARQSIQSAGDPSRQHEQRVEQEQVIPDDPLLDLQDDDQDDDQVVQQDEWIELEYPQLRLGYYRNAATGKEMLAYLRVSGDAHQLREALKVGDEFSSFTQVLGRLEPVGPGLFEACDRWDRGDCLRLRVYEGQVMELEKLALIQ